MLRRRSTFQADLGCRIGGVELPNPVMTAAGTGGFGTELGAYLDLRDLGAVVTKSISCAPWGGNPAPRIVPTAAGMLNSVGLQNPGLPAWSEQYLGPLRASGARVVVSIWGRSEEEYLEAGRLVRTMIDDRQVGGGPEAQQGPGLAGSTGTAERRDTPAGGPGKGRIVAVEANISCPNVEDRGRMFAHAADSAGAVVRAVRRGLGTFPLWVKLSPNVTDLVTIAQAVAGAGADALVLTNTLMGLALDPLSGTTRLGAGGGGLSGPALHPVVVRAVYECHAALPRVPIVGVGGVSSGADAAELLAAGASAVQVGTANFADPRASLRVLTELMALMRRHRMTTLGEFGAGG